MNYMIQQASDATIAELHATPTLITAFISSPFPSLPKAAGFLSRLFGTGTAQPVDDSTTFATGTDYCDVGGDWHGLHFLFAGSDWNGEPPASFLLNWGTEIGAIDLNYGTARSFTSAEALEIHRFLQSLDHETLNAAFDSGKMIEMEIYPFAWDREDILEELLVTFDSIKSFVKTTVERSHGLVVHLG